MKYDLTSYNYDGYYAVRSISDVRSIDPNAAIMNSQRETTNRKNSKEEVDYGNE